MSNNLQISEDKNLIQFSTKAQDNLKALSGALQQVNLFLADLEKEQSEQTYNDVKIEDVAQEGEN